MDILLFRLFFGLGVVSLHHVFWLYELGLVSRLVYCGKTKSRVRSRPSLHLLNKNQVRVCFDFGSQGFSDLNSSRGLSLRTMFYAESYFSSFQQGVLFDRGYFDVH